MPSLSPSDTAFIVSQHYVGKSAVQIQRKFSRDRKQKVALSTVSRWLTRVKTEFEESSLNSTVYLNETMIDWSIKLGFNVTFHTKLKFITHTK